MLEWQSHCSYFVGLTELFLVSQSFHKKLAHIEWLKIKKYIVSQFWKPDVQSQSTGRAIFPLKFVEEDLSHASVLVSGGCQQPVAFLERKPITSNLPLY